MPARKKLHWSSGTRHFCAASPLPTAANRDRQFKNGTPEILAVKRERKGDDTLPGRLHLVRSNSRRPPNADDISINTRSACAKINDGVINNISRGIVIIIINIAREKRASYRLYGT